MGRKSFSAAQLKQLAIVSMGLSAWLLAVVFLTSCGAAPIKKHVESASVSPISVCHIVAHKRDYIGKTVEIMARMQTDHFQYSYFENLSANHGRCNADDVIQLGYIYKMHDKSVVAFLNEGKKLCEMKHQPVLCVQTASVTFIGTIRSDKDGLYVQLNKVLSYKYK